MLVKFFSNKQGGSVSGINYLLNHRVKDQTARVLKGDETYTQNNQIKNLKEDLISLQINLEQITKENLELSNLNNNYQQEIKSLTDSKQTFIDRYKKDTNGLKNKLQESQDVNFILKIAVVALLILLIMSAIVIWKIRSNNSILTDENKHRQ